MRTITGLLLLSLCLLTGGSALGASLELVVSDATNAASAPGSNQISLLPGGGSVTVDVLYTVGSEGLSFIQFDLRSTASAVAGTEATLILDPAGGPGAMAPGNAGVSVVGTNLEDYDLNGINGGIFDGSVVLGSGVFSFSGAGTIEPFPIQVLDSSGFSVELTLSGATISIVPEPGTWALLATGLVVVGVRRRGPCRLAPRGAQARSAARFPLALDSTAVTPPSTGRHTPLM